MPAEPRMSPAPVDAPPEPEPEKGPSPASFDHTADEVERYDYLSCDVCVEWVERMRPEFELRLAAFTAELDHELEMVRFAGMFHRNGHIEPGTSLPVVPEVDDDE